ncbi:lysosomal alpha-mannosidase-like [Condylostylus longicornis]|uniref:lysosomal alpha-mannosidase-like n=1 Tax=Condylostylus longicornis TaxID=2530218 RepID=UPI00244E2934|nr:lysosomal alpha-mannosidase-like [Condylostylus longicornis]
MKLTINFVIVCILYLQLLEARPSKETFNGKCGYSGCPVTPTDTINIHLVPHTHDDVGWLKTVDQYYYGQYPLIQKAGVEFILDSVIAELLKDKSRRFIYVESAFFFKWWNQQEKKLQDKVKQLVEEGQLEFIGGAWSMNDEATTHYQSLIDQFSYGLKKLNDTFGLCGRPRVGWQIDPFGHSKEMASIFAGMKFDGMFFARLDWRDKINRFSNMKAEMVWRASESLGRNADLFTGILRNHYSAPPGFCFDYLCQDEPIIDGDGYENNVKDRLDVFYDYVKNMTKYHKTKNIMLPMGDDFNYQDASMYYKNMDKLIKYSENRKVGDKDVNIFYSTPSCYLKSLNDANELWPVENDDFFPYATDNYTYWAGYYSSRPTLKRYERIGNNVLQVCKKILAANLEDSTQNLNFLREVMGIMQHHDAITGTEKQHVADDYAHLLHDAISACDNDISNMLTKVLKPDPIIHGDLEFKPCHKLNESTCEITENSENFMVTLFNPLSRETSSYIRIPIRDNFYEILDSEGNPVKSYRIRIPEPVKSITGRNSSALYDMVFKANLKDITSYYVKKKDKNDFENEILLSKNVEKNNSRDFDIDNKKIKLSFKNGFLNSIEILEERKTIEFRQEFSYFEAAAGNNAPPFVNRSSGAYIYRPKTKKIIATEVEVERFKFDENVEVTQIFNDWISQVIRLYENESIIEFEWLIGPIPVNDKIGKEVVSHFKTNIDSGNIFYTDSNGREMIKRKYTVDELEKEPIASNFYPITTKLAIEDTKSRMAILTDRAQGAACLKSGECEILVHRRLLHDDAFGVGEALNETTTARGKFHVFFGQSDEATIAKERQIQAKQLLEPYSVFSSLKNIKFEDWQKLKHEDASKIINVSTILPESIILLTFEPFGTNKTLLRLENIYEKEAGGTEITVNLKEIADHFKAKSFEEATLDGNQWLRVAKRLIWNTEKEYNEIFNDKINEEDMSSPFDVDVANVKDDEEFEITLKPMQIRTVIMTRS